MSIPFNALKEHFTNLTFTDENIILELGSGVNEGSTQFFHDYSIEKNVTFYSVDVVPATKEALPNVNCIVASSGEDWCRDILPTLGKKIKILYLDNFDFCWWWWEDPRSPHYSYLEYIKSTYAERGVVLNRENCMEAHKIQMEYCLPFLDDQSVIIMDDTFYLESEDIYYGKCAMVVPMLIDAGYSIHQHSWSGYVAYKNCNV